MNGPAPVIGITLLVLLLVALFLFIAHIDGRKVAWAVFGITAVLLLVILAAIYLITGSLS